MNTCINCCWFDNYSDNALQCTHPDNKQDANWDTCGLWKEKDGCNNCYWFSEYENICINADSWNYMGSELLGLYTCDLWEVKDNG